MKRGDVVGARLDPVVGSEQGGTRPAVVVSADDFNATVGVVTIVPVTTFRRRSGRVYPSEALLKRGTGGLRTDSVALAHQVRTVDQSRIGRRIGVLPPDALALVIAALADHVGHRCER